MRRPDEAFIPGLSEYCDRWCERCPLTSRCRVYASEQRDRREGDDDLASAAFWERFTSALETVRESIEDELARREITLTETDLAAAEEAARADMAEAARHPLVVAARAYAAQAREWLDAHEEALAQTLDRRQLSARLDPAAAEEEDRLVAALEVIRWYQHQVGTKLFRAADPGELALAREDPESDANGSAKVALIGVDRSLAAWSVLHEELPAEQDTILDLLVALDRLRRATERHLPLARAFVRPGFDEAP